MVLINNLQYPLSSDNKSTLPLLKYIGLIQNFLSTSYINSLSLQFFKKLLKAVSPKFNNSLAKNITITYQIAKVGDSKNKTPITTTLDKFLEAMETAGEKNLSIYLYGEENINKMRQALVRGVQAKSGANQAIFNDAPVSINQAIQVESSLYSRWLSLLTQLVHNNDTDGDMNYYNSLFNYCLAKLQTTLIGRDNNIILTRFGFSTVKNYMQHLIQEQHIYIHAKNKINIHAPNDGNIVTIKQNFFGK